MTSLALLAPQRLSRRDSQWLVTPFRCTRNVFGTKPGLIAAVDNRMHFFNHERTYSALGMCSAIDYEHTLKAATEAS